MHKVDIAVEPSNTEQQPKKNCAKKLSRNILAGTHTFFMPRLWPMCTPSQRFRLCLVYMTNMTFSALQPISAMFLSKSLQMIASNDSSFTVLGIKVTPKISLYFSVILLGLNFFPSYIKSSFLAGIAANVELKRIKQILTEYNQLDYEQHLSLQEYAKEVLTDLVESDRAIILASTDNLQPQLFNLIAATLAGFFLEHKSLTWVIIPYIFAALVMKELLSCCAAVRKSNTPIASKYEALQRLQPSYAKSAMMYNFGRHKLELRTTQKIILSANKNRGIPKWHQNYQLLLGILTLALSMYYIETVADTGLTADNIGQVTYILSYLSTLFTNFISFNQSIDDATSGIEAHKKSRKLMRHLLAVQTIDHAIEPTRASSDHCLEFRNVSYHYPSHETARETLNDINLCAGPNEVVTISGLSVMGKSTFAKLAGGLNCPTGGAAFISGKNVNQLSPTERSRIVAFVPQIPKLQNNKSVLYHMLYAICTDQILYTLHENSSEAILELIADTDYYYKVVRALTACGLNEPRIHTTENQLAASDRYKLSLAMAYIQDSPVIVVDQILNQFDKETSQQLATIIQDMDDKCRIIVTNSTHLFSNPTTYTLADGTLHRDTPDLEATTHLTP